MQIRELLKQAVDLLQATNGESPRIDAELLMMHVTRYSRVQLLTHDSDELSQLDEVVFRALLEERCSGQPIAYLLGERDFWDLTLKVTPDTLIPRPDTEVLVEKALTLIQCNHMRNVLDLGTGTGAIILALKHSVPEINATAIDLSQAALDVAQENAVRYQLDVKFMQGSWFTPLIEQSLSEQERARVNQLLRQESLCACLAPDPVTGARAPGLTPPLLSAGETDPNVEYPGSSVGAGAVPAAATSQLDIRHIDGNISADIRQPGYRENNHHIYELYRSRIDPHFDLIVSNPPYVEEGDPHLRTGDVRFEPRSALVAGKDGLDDIKLIIHEAKAFLKDNGYLILEHGYNQGDAVRHLFNELGYSRIETIRDYGQNERVTLACYKRS